MGTDTSELVFCIDFGLSKRFRNPHTLAHIPHRVGKSLTGTPRYASINNHLGIEQVAQPTKHSHSTWRKNTRSIQGRGAGLKIA